MSKWKNPQIMIMINGQRLAWVLFYNCPGKELRVRKEVNRIATKKTVSLLFLNSLRSISIGAKWLFNICKAYSSKSQAIKLIKIFKNDEYKIAEGLFIFRKSVIDKKNNTA